MVTDRTGTMALVILLTHLYKEYMLLGILLCMLDLISHWFRMYSYLLNTSHHKDLNPRHHWLLNLYYGNKKVMGATCLLNEMFYLFAYVIRFYSLSPLFSFQDLQIDILKLTTLFCFPLFFFKQITNILQLYHSSEDIVLFEFPTSSAQEDSSSKKKK